MTMSKGDVLAGCAAAIPDAVNSFVGMFVLLTESALTACHPIRLFCALSAISAAGIESEVYSQLIYQARCYLFAKEGLKHRRLQYLLRDQYNQSPQDRHAFLVLYALCYREWQALDELHHKTKVQWARQKEHEAVLCLLEDELFRYISGERCSDPEVQIILEKTDLLTSDEKKEFLASYHRKENWVLLAKGFIPLSMVGSYFCTLGAAKIVLGLLGLGASATGVGLIVIAAVATIAYALMTYQTFMHIIYDDLIHEYASQFKQSFSQGGVFKKIVLGVASVIFVGLLVGLTLATAGTWWKSGIAGQQALIHLSYKISLLPFVLPYIVSSILFTVKNTCQSLYQLRDTSGFVIQKKIKLAWKRHISDPWSELTTASVCLLVKHAFWKPVLYPLCVVAYTLHIMTHALFSLWGALFFLVHCLSEAVTVEKAFWLSKPMAAVPKGALELGADLHFLTESKALSSPSPKDELPLTSLGGHHHANIPQKILFLPLLPLLLLNCFLHKILSGDTWHVSCQKQVGIYWGAHDHAEAILAKQDVKTDPLLGRLFKEVRYEAMQKKLVKPTAEAQVLSHALSFYPSA